MAVVKASEVTMEQVVAAINQANRDFFDLENKFARLESRLDNVFPIPTTFQVHRLAGFNAISLGIFAGALATGGLIMYLERQPKKR